MQININNLGGLVTSPSALDRFDILVKDKSNNNVMTFEVKTKSSFGVFRRLFLCNA